MSPDSVIEFPGMRRIHIGLSVVDVERSRAFYETMFGVPPTKVRPGYVKFEPQDPSVNLSLHGANPERIGTRGASGATHFGVQVKSAGDVQQAAERLAAAGIELKAEWSVTCCHAVQDKVWATDPDGNRWEVFVVTADADHHGSPRPQDCCEDCACAPTHGDEGVLGGERDCC